MQKDKSKECNPHYKTLTKFDTTEAVADPWGVLLSPTIMPFHLHVDRPYLKSPDQIAIYQGD